MSRHVAQGCRAGHGHTPKCVSCPVPLSRPSALRELAIGPLLRGQPNELDAVHLTATHHTTRLSFFHGAVESLASCLRYLLFGTIRRVLSIKLGAHMLEVAGAHLRAIRERANYLPAVDNGARQHAPQQLHRGRPVRLSLSRLLRCLPVDDWRGNWIAVVVCPDFQHSRRERYLEPGSTIPLLAHGQPGVHDAAAQFPVGQDCDDCVGSAFLGGRTASAGFYGFAKMVYADDQGARPRGRNSQGGQYPLCRSRIIVLAAREASRGNQRIDPNQGHRQI